MLCEAQEAPSSGNVLVRAGTELDLARLNEIYNYYVLNSNATFDSEPWNLERRRQWFERYAVSGPHRLLVAESCGLVLGCASSSQYRSHPSFKETVEFGIYLDPRTRGKGIGKRLYQELFLQLENESVHSAVAGIALPNPASVQLHKSFRFREVGVFAEYAVKNGRFISSAWFQKILKA